MLKTHMQNRGIGSIQQMYLETIQLVGADLSMIDNYNTPQIREVKTSK
jgi:hypothetical protein